jgi:hypothetical protein
MPKTIIINKPYKQNATYRIDRKPAHKIKLLSLANVLGALIERK